VKLILGNITTCHNPTINRVWHFAENSVAYLTGLWGELAFVGIEKVFLYNFRNNRR
jgi:hypothetical protein